MNLLLFSYIVAASLELVMAAQTYNMGYLSFTWSYGFLLFMSIASIPLETSNMGRLVRSEFKSLGVDTARYDLLSNISRSIVYLFVLGKYISHLTGLILAYSVTFIILIFTVSKYIKAEKNKD